MNLLIDEQQSFYRMFNFVINDNFIKYSFVTTIEIQFSQMCCANVAIRIQLI